MSDPADKDVLGKADALLRRHSAVGEDTAPVPVLTDLYEGGAPAGDATAPPPAGEADSDDDISREVFDRVITQVEGRLASGLERHLAGEVQAAVASAVAGLRGELAGLVSEALAEALKARQVK